MIKTGLRFLSTTRSKVFSRILHLKQLAASILPPYPVACRYVYVVYFTAAKITTIVSYFFFFVLMQNQFNVIAKQFALFIKQVVSAPIKQHYFYNLRYFIDFKYMNTVNVIIYLYFYTFKVFLLWIFVVYQAVKFSYRILKWTTVTSSFFLNLRRAFRQRMYMVYNTYHASKRNILIFLKKRKTINTLQFYLSALNNNCFFY